MSGLSIKAIFVSGLIGLAGVFSAGASAQAATPVVSLAMSGPTAGEPVVQVNHRHGHYNRPQHRPNHRNVCSPRDARSQASRMGIRQARVHSNRMTVRVSGYRHGRPASVVFRNTRGCPILR